jgi:hypothetical protein
MRSKKTLAVAGLILLVLFAGAAFISFGRSQQGVVADAGSAVFDHSDPDMFANGPGNTACVRCHSDSPLTVYSDFHGEHFYLDDRDGSELFKNGYYEPGRTYQLRAIIQDTDMSTWGFECRVIGEDGATAGTLAGFPNRTTTYTSTQGGRAVTAVGNERLRYRHNGRYDGPVGWRFSWTAPREGEVRFFVEGIAGNRDRTPFGDHSYYVDGVKVNPAPGGK